MNILITYKMKLFSFLNAIVSPFNIFIIPAHFDSKIMRLIERMVFVRFGNKDIKYKKEISNHIERWCSKKNAVQMPASMWRAKNLKKEIRLPHFRSDNKYIYQTRDNNTPDSAVLTFKYLKSKDLLNILDRSKENGAFGADVVRIPTFGLVSRDLLDSANELNFLENTIGISKIENLTIFDIGSGYGRLAVHSIINLKNIEKYVCLDAVPESLGICEFYLKYKQLDPEKYHISFLSENYSPPENSIAVAIHSFSEMPLESVLNWVRFLKEMETGWILIVPNREKHEGRDLLATEVDGSRPDYSSLLLEYGYEKHGIFPKYEDPDIQEFGISPTMYHLYKRSKKESI